MSVCVSRGVACHQLGCRRKHHLPEIFVAAQSHPCCSSPGQVVLAGCHSIPTRDFHNTTTSRISAEAGLASCCFAGGLVRLGCPPVPPDPFPGFWDFDSSPALPSTSCSSTHSCLLHGAGGCMSRKTPGKTLLFGIVKKRTRLARDFSRYAGNRRLDRSTGCCLRC